jgi:DNA-binding transcriptional LysR family regulator
MQTRHQGRDLPTELVRALVTISETGSFTRAARKLCVSQPAITAQIKRLQALVGGELFAKTPGGVELNDRGRLVVDIARKMLRANDEILALTGGLGEAQPLRVGISNVYAERFLQAYARSGSGRYLHIFCGRSDEISLAFRDAHVDLSCSFEPLSSDRPIEEWHQAFVWVRAPTFMIRPDQPIPIVTWPGSFLARIMTESLDEVGLRHRIVFSSADYGARKAAAAAGLGLMAIPPGFTEPNLTIAEARILPRLPDVRAGICVRKGLASADTSVVVDALRSLSPI